MVAPLVIAGVAMAVGAVMQYYNSEKARGATAERLKQIEKLFDKVKPPNLDIKVYDDPKIAAQIPPGDYDFSSITPEEYKLVAKIAPEAAPYVAEKAPQIVQASKNAMSGRTAQLEALRRFRSIAEGEDDPQLQQMLMESSRKARGDAQSRQASILQDFQRRGTGGPGAELALQSRGASDAMQTQAMESQGASAEAYRNRLQALSSGAQLGGQVRQSEMGEAKTNADIINDYNQRSSSRYQQYLQARADSIYDARVKEETMKQGIDDANVSGRNKMRVEDLDRQNRLRQQQRGERVDERDYQRGLAGDKMRVQQQKFGNELDVARGKAGIQSQGIDYMRSDARDRNQAIQGVTDTVAAGSMYYDRYNRPKPEDPQEPQDGGFNMDPYDEGTTPGKYRNAKSDRWRTA